MKTLSITAIGSLLIALPTTSALSGYGSNTKYTDYSPICAHACLRVFGASRLECSSTSQLNTDLRVPSMYTSPQCLANNEYFLASLAYCVSTKCPATTTDATQRQFFAKDRNSREKLDWFWQNRITGNRHVAPKWSYAQALERVVQPPTRVANVSGTLDYIGLADDGYYMQQAGTLWSVYRESVNESTFGIIFLVTGFGLPILVTLLANLPFTSRPIGKINLYLVWPSAVGTYHVRPLPWRVGNAPTTGQAIYIAVMMFLAIVLTAVDYKLVKPHTWYGESLSTEGMAYVMWRTGSLAFAILPLVFLFSGRNNVLLWVTNWSHSTLLLLHRWMARIFGPLAVVHTVLGVVVYTNTRMIASNQNQGWWTWGIVAVCVTGIMLVISILLFRQRSYELFLALHIILAAATLIGCWYHVFLRFGLVWGYQEWLYACFAVWAFDRLVRLGRIAWAGVHRSKVTDLGNGYVQVDVPGVRWSAAPGQHAYVHFPSLTPKTPWQNHPFSVAPSYLLEVAKEMQHRHGSADLDDVDIEKSQHSSSTASGKGRDKPARGVTFFIKKSSGVTKALSQCDNVLTLLDGPYANGSSRAALKCDRLVVISGGIGITGVSPWLTMHDNTKLYWSVRKSASSLVHAAKPMLAKLADKEVLIGQRHNVRHLLAQEAQAGWRKIGVVVCGPGGLCDDVRAAVVELGRKGQFFEVEVDAYSW